MQNAATAARRLTIALAGCAALCGCPAQNYSTVYNASDAEVEIVFGMRRYADDRGISGPCPIASATVRTKPASPLQANWASTAWADKRNGIIDRDACTLTITLRPGHSAVVSMNDVCSDDIQQQRYRDEPPPKLNFLKMTGSAGVVSASEWAAVGLMKRVSESMCTAVYGGRQR